MSPGFDPVSAATDWVVGGVDVEAGESSGVALGVGEEIPLAGAMGLGEVEVESFFGGG